MIGRLPYWKNMRDNAHRYSIPFTRRATFKPPESICNGRCIRYPDEDGVRNDFISIFIGDCYRLRRIRSNLQTVLDIGANVGFFSIAARVNFPNARVHAYDPNRSLVTYLERNRSEFGFDLFYEAAGGSDGHVRIDQYGDSNLTRARDDDSGAITKVSVDQIIARIGGSVDLMKIDCEGAEWEMFLNGGQWRAVSRIAIEYHNFNGQNHDFIGDELRRLRFTVVEQSFDPRADFGMVYAINDDCVQSWH